MQEEEIGLNGAKALNSAALGLTARRLVNMDSEEWGEICIGCAGGGHSTITLPAEPQAVPAGSALVHMSVSGLMGGHSGLMIHEGRCGRFTIVVMLPAVRWHLIGSSHALWCNPLSVTCHGNGAARMDMGSDCRNVSPA